jgi:hypothetical protein
MKISIAQVRRVIAEEVRRRLNELEDQVQFYKKPEKRAPTGPPVVPDKRHFIHAMQLATKMYKDGMDLISITYELEKRGFDQDDIDMIFNAMNEALIRRLQKLTEMRDEHNVIRGPWAVDHREQNPDYMQQHDEQNIRPAVADECEDCDGSKACPMCGGNGAEKGCPFCISTGHCSSCNGDEIRKQRSPQG